MPRIFDTPLALHDAVGEVLGVSDWLVLAQERIDRFAEATAHTHSPPLTPMVCAVT